MLASATKLWVRYQLLVLLFAYIVISVIYAFSTPLFEASDELRHFGMVDYLHNHQVLPVQDPNIPNTTYHQEGSQPPLYYIVSALITSPFDFSNFPAIAQENPHAQLGIPHIEHNKNMVLHDGLSLEGAVIVAYFLRMIGI
jgi:hypothetical protein